MKLFDRASLFTFFIAFISVLFWAIEESKFEANSIPSYIAATAGIIAIVFMSFSLIASTRLKFLEIFSNGLDANYKFHSYIGKFATIIILFHPLMLTIQRFAGLDTIKRYFLPGTIEFFNWGIVAFWLLLVLVIVTLYVKIDYKWWKYTHFLMVLVYLFASYHVFLDYTNAQRSPGITLREAWMLVIIALGILACIYKELIYPFLFKKFVVTKVNPIGLVTEVYMRPERQFKFIPGQFVFISVKNNKDLSAEIHPFGITSGVDDEDIRVSIKALGDYTKKAGLIKPGNTIHVWGPYGMFTWDSVKKYNKQIWIGGGIGIAPFLGMLKYSNKIKSDKDITLFYVEKNESECEYNSELRELTKDSNIKFYNHYDQVDGFISAKYVEEKVGSLKDAVVMICGPKPMMKALKLQFETLGLRPEQIREEVFEMRQ